MKLLLDTNVLLWAANGDLKPEIVNFINSDENTVFYSTVSIWEIVIKRGLGRPDLIVDPYKLTDKLCDVGYRRVDIKEDHILAVGGLPLFHNDPFDRLLIAQAAYERMTLLSSDSFIAQYQISLINVSRA